MQTKDKRQMAYDDTSFSNGMPLPFHLSICVDSLNTARLFYGEILGLEERRSTTKSIHYNMFGSQLTLHEVPGYNAHNIQREVDSEDVPVPHFGFFLPDVESFDCIAEKLKDAKIDFVKKPALRFIGTKHEQYVLFMFDPAGNAIEIKNSVHAKPYQWL